MNKKLVRVEKNMSEIAKDICKLDLVFDLTLNVHQNCPSRIRLE